jgi:hypothetical protein
MRHKKTILATLLASGLTVGTALAQAPQPNTTTSPTNDRVPNQTTNPSNTNNPANQRTPPDAVTPPNPSLPNQPATDRQVPLSPAEKAVLFDKMPEKDRMAAWKTAGRDLSKMSETERADAVAKMSAQDKADAYDKLSPQQQRQLSDQNRNK